MIFKIRICLIILIQIVAFMFVSQAVAQEQVFDNIQFIQMSPQSYQFGSLGSQAGRTMYERHFEMPMSHTFWMSKYEITQAQWMAIMGGNPSTHRGLGPVESHPVETVSWHDVQLFIDRLNTIAGGDYYRLPTEAEWEYVAKANSESTWFFGDNPLNLSTYAHRDNNPYPRARGEKQANIFGVHDLYGNIYEWVEDWYVIERDPLLEACPPKSGIYKVLRGGSNSSADRYLRPASRNFSLPERRSWKVGFRLVRIADPASDYYRTGDLCFMGEGVDETDALIFLDNRNYIKCFGGLTIGADFMECAFPLFNSLTYSQQAQNNKMLGLQSTGPGDQAGHSYILDQLGAYLGYTADALVTTNEGGLDNMWQGTGTADNQYCYIDGEIRNWQQTPACNGGLNGSSEVISTFRLVKNRANNDCNNGEEGVFYVDADGDGFGDSNRQTNRCTQLISLSRVSGDCNDRDPLIKPSADETCNNVDDNCDGQVDNNPIDGSTFYQDSDGDSFGAANQSVQACIQPNGYVSNSNDCNDQEASIKPNANELCNEIDDNCDGQIDNNPSNGSNWYRDVDGDGFGDLNNSTIACLAPNGYVPSSTDCNDQDRTVKPNATETCNEVDDNCDGQVDNDSSDGTTWYRDADGDSFGNVNVRVLACVQPNGYVNNADDCNDQNGGIKPNATETCNEIDDNCDGQVDNNPSDGTTWYRDADGDSFGLITDSQVACAVPNGYVANFNDCNDQNAAIKPNANEVCNAVDDNCDGLIDNEATDGTTWYRDADGDSFGTLGTTSVACSQPNGYVNDSSDCNDNNQSIRFCSSCADIIASGAGAGVYSLDPCGSGTGRDFWCDADGWTYGGKQPSSGTLFLGISNSGDVSGTNWSRDLSCINFSEIKVFNENNGQVYSRNYGANTWLVGFQRSGNNIALGSNGNAFKLGTYGGGAVMGCVDYSYSGGNIVNYACDSDGQRSARGHFAQYAGEYCSGGRLDGTWAWTNGNTCSLRGQNYIWGIAIR